MRAMKAADAVGKRFRVTAACEDDFPDERTLIGRAGTCVDVLYVGGGMHDRYPVSIDLDDPDHLPTPFAWRELELVD